MVEQRLGVTFRRTPSFDWNEHLAALESGECAIAPTIVRTVERERFAFFTTPYLATPVVIISAQPLGSDLTIDDLAGKRVAIVSGYASEDYLREHAQGRFEVVPMPDVKQGLRAASFGQVDVYVENLAVAAYYIEQEGIPNLSVVGSTDLKFDFSIGVCRKYPLLFSAIQKALDAIPDNELTAVRQRWISLRARSGMSLETKRLIILISVFTVLLLLSSVGISLFLKRKLKERLITLETAQKKTMQSEAKFRAIFENAPYAIVISRH